MQHQHQLQICETKLVELNNQHNELSLLVTDLTAREQKLRNDISSLSSKHTRLISKKHDLQLEFTKQEQIYVQNQRHQERVQEESKLLTQEITHLDGEIGDLTIDLEDKQLIQVELTEQNYTIELKKLDSETSLNLAKSKLQELDNRNNQLIMDSQLLNQQKKHALDLIDDKQLQLAAARHKLNELSSERQSVSSTDQAQEIILLQSQIAEVAGAMQITQGLLNDSSTKIISLKNSAASLNSKYQKNLENINQTKFRVQEQTILLGTYREQINEFGVSDDELAQLATDNSYSLSEIQAKCKTFTEQITALGLVNLKAIEDLANASSHQQELFIQIEDLNAAVATLTQAIEQIDGETRKLLQTTFDDLNKALVVYFRSLFGGGNARLALTEGDILSAGVQIFAEPPGKKNSTIHLLSGGEKALAAMSFIFALFSLNPAPFCLLDEVDAPLDDANTGRFCTLVQELASKTQFVYISHNRLAMEMADQLVGVTMQEKGVSTVVSVSLVEAIQHIELAPTVV